LWFVYGGGFIVEAVMKSLSPRTIIGEIKVVVVVLGGG
jgi:hypothetical protein